MTTCPPESRNFGNGSTAEAADRLSACVNLLIRPLGHATDRLTDTPRRGCYHVWSPGDGVRSRNGGLAPGVGF